MWLLECYRIIKPGAPILIFIDWRQYSVIANSLQVAGFMWQGTVVWDKTQAVRPQMGRYRQQCEFVLWGSKGKLNATTGKYLP